MCCLCSGHLEIVIVSGCEDVTIASRNFIHGLNLGRKEAYFVPSNDSLNNNNNISINYGMCGRIFYNTSSNIWKRKSGNSSPGSGVLRFASSVFDFINIEINNNVVLKVVNFATNVTRYWTYEVIRIWKG